MAGGTADEREILVDLAVRQSPPLLHRPQEMESLPIPEELLPDIFLRLPDPADLVRASAACVSFRRLVADRSFLRQYRKVHVPPLLGFIQVKGEFHRASPPYPSASAASAVALAADFYHVEAGEGMLGMLVLPCGSSDLNYIIRRNNVATSGQWQLEKTIYLGYTYGYHFAGSTGGHLFLEHEGAFFFLDVNTFQLERVSVSASEHRLLWPRAYSNFPPSLLSSPTVASGLEIGAKKETPEQGCAASSE